VSASDTRAAQGSRGQPVVATGRACSQPSSPAATLARRVERGAVAAAALAAGAGVLFAGWPPLLVLALFWVENLIVAANQSLRILLVGARDGWVGLFGGAVVALIFAAFAMLFWLVHAELIVSVVGDASLQPTGVMLESAQRLVDRVRDTAEAWPLLGLMVLLAVLDTLRWSFASRTDPMLEDLGAMMKTAVTRMTALQGALLVGGFILDFIDAPQLIVLLLVAFKFGLDLTRLSSEDKSSFELAGREGARWKH
jgi:hypothetical protein